LESEHLSVDLEHSLTYVIARISEQAERSAAPLGDDEIDFLHHPPTQPTNPTVSWGFHTAGQDSWPILALRDFEFERLCNLAKDAHAHDLRTRPDAAREWGFAGAVLQLHRHPLSWLLQWAHIRTAQRPARWDRLLLVATATLVVVVFILGAMALSVVTDGQRDAWKWTLCGIGACIYAAFLTFLYFAVRRLEARQRKQNIEEFRCDLPPGDSSRRGARTISSSQSVRRT
jgi:hypothetical protein